jgi:phospholipase C
VTKPDEVPTVIATGVAERALSFSAFAELPDAASVAARRYACCPYEGAGDAMGAAVMTRRRFLRLAAGAAASGTLSACGRSVIEHAYQTDPLTTGSSHDIDHFVFLMQENRSFDHYFGTMSGVRGFDSAKIAVLRQRGYRPGVGPSPHGVLMP